jgi:outer membrane lipoprotein-sorting protein
MKLARHAAAPVLAVCALLALPSAAGDVKSPGSLTPLEILKKSDDFHFGYKDVHMKLFTVVKDKDGKKTELKYEMWAKGEKRLLIFSHPPEASGLAVLAKDADTIYVYEPEFNKVRRIASHAKKQGMLGMDYTMDEMGMQHLHKYYDPKLESEDEKQAVLWLEQKAGLDKAWPKLKVVIEKDKHWAMTKIEYYDKKGKKKKTEVRKKFKKFPAGTSPSVMMMTSHAKKHSTTIIIKLLEVDTGLPDEMFSKRYLIREE